MLKLDEIQIYLLDINQGMCEAWNKYFLDIQNISVVNDEFRAFVFNNTDNIQAIVSPANSFGIMSGGYDKAIIDYFGPELMEAVQKYIISNYYGEQPVGTAFTIQIPNNQKYLIHCPTMRTPEIIRDPRTVYSCMRSTLIECMKNDIKSVVIPAFGGCTGNVAFENIAYLMRKAYNQLDLIPENLSWNSVVRI